MVKRRIQEMELVRYDSSSEEFFVDQDRFGHFLWFFRIFERSRSTGRKKQAATQETWDFRGGWHDPLGANYLEPACLLKRFNCRARCS